MKSKEKFIFSRYFKECLEEYRGNDEIVVIPSFVTEIMSTAFAGNTSIKVVVLPDGLIRMGSQTFKDCTSLERVVAASRIEEEGKILLPVNTIPGIDAFNGCTMLADENGFIRVGNIITDYIGNSPDIVIPEGVTKIYDYAFVRGKVKSIVFPRSMHRIYRYAFLYVHNISEIVIRDPKQLPVTQRIWAIRGFVNKPQYFNTEETEMYKKYIKGAVPRIIDKAIEYPEILRYMLDNKLITAKNIGRYIDAAGAVQDIEALAMLLDYNCNKLTEADMKNLQKSDERVARTVLNRKNARKNSKELKGLNIVFNCTASLEDRIFVESQGGRVKESVSSLTDYLVVSDFQSSGYVTSKLSKAKELNIEIIRESDFYLKYGREFRIEGIYLTRYFGNQDVVRVPDGVRRIDSHVFDGKDIKAVYLPITVKRFMWTFRDCKTLTDIYFPDGANEIECMEYTVIPSGVTVHAPYGSPAHTLSRNLPGVKFIPT